MRLLALWMMEPTHCTTLHYRRKEADNPPFTKEQVQRYIKAARQIKPSFSEMAQVDMTSAYAELRSGDAAPGSHSAYRCAGIFQDLLFPPGLCLKSFL